MIARTENFTVRQAALIQILRLYEDPNVSPRSLEKIIEQDAALTAKVLRVATSSLYGAKSTVSVGRALSVLGINTLRSISISLAYQEILNRKTKGANFDREVFSRHCRAVAIGAKAIAKIMTPALIEEMYIAGLMHDIGILCLDRFAPTLLNMAIKKAQLSQVCLCDTERQVLQYDHCDVGGLLAEKWKLSPLMTNAIRFHHRPEGEGNKSLSTAIVIAADFLAYRCGFPAMTDIPIHSEAEIYFNELGLSEDHVDLICRTIVAEVDMAERTFNDRQPVCAA